MGCLKIYILLFLFSNSELINMPFFVVCFFFFAFCDILQSLIKIESFVDIILFALIKWIRSDKLKAKHPFQICI